MRSIGGGALTSLKGERIINIEDWNESVPGIAEETRLTTRLPQNQRREFMFDRGGGVWCRQSTARGSSNNPILDLFKKKEYWDNIGTGQRARSEMG